MTRKSKLLVLLILFLALTVSAFSQETISPEDAANYIGQQKTVCGTVASAQGWPGNQLLLYLSVLMNHCT